MANRLQIKRNTFGSDGAPSANSLLTGELAYDGYNQKLYIGRQEANNGNAQDVVVTDLGATIVPVATSSQKGVVKIDTTDFNITGAGALSLATTSTAAELNLVDGASAGTIVNSKAAIYGGSGQLNMTTLQIGGTSVTSTAAELNLVDGITPGTASASKAVILDSNKDLTGIRHLTIAGDLTVQGNTTTLNTSTLDVEDINITVAKNAADSSAADGAGLTVDGASATFTYSHSGTKWNMNKSLDIVGTLEVTQGITNTTLDFGVYQ
tara:strand:+ start:247 stop:1044 length:798 start_codon:yes stop_codon:yes gene_type:complete